MVMAFRLLLRLVAAVVASPAVLALRPATLAGAATRLSQLRGAAGNGTSPGTIAVAVVGNGPLSEEDRRQIRSADEVYRFNAMPNLRFGERVGRVFVRRAGDFGDDIWGVPYTRLYCPRISEAEEVIIIVNGQGGPVSDKKLRWMREQFPLVEVAPESVKSVTIEGKTYRSDDGPNRFAKWTNSKAQTIFSSGFVGVAHVMGNSKAVAQGNPVHVFGMNWKKRSVHAAGHRNVFNIEEEAIRSAKHVIVHDTPTDDYKPRNATEEKVLWRCENNGDWRGGPSRSYASAGPRR